MSQTVTDRQQDDLLWASENYETMLDSYLGEYVVIHDRQVVAHGTDLEVALSEASKITGKPQHELSDCAIIDPLEDIPH